MRPPQSLRITQPKLLWAKGFWHTFRQGGALAAHVVWTARRFTQPQGYSAEPSAPVIRPSKVRGKYSSWTNTTRITPPAGRHVARNVLIVLVTFTPYCTHSSCCQPRVCPARLASEIRFLPYVGSGPRWPGRRFVGGRSHRCASLRKRLTTTHPSCWAGRRKGFLA